jgi:hypothetical protein
LLSRLRTYFVGTQKEEKIKGKKGASEELGNFISPEEQAWEDYHNAIAKDFNPLTDLLIVPTKIKWLMERSPYKNLVQDRIVYMDNVRRISTIRTGGGQRPLPIPMPTTKL